MVVLWIIFTILFVIINSMSESVDLSVSSEGKEKQRPTQVRIFAQNLLYRVKAQDLKKHLEEIKEKYDPDILFLTELTTNSPYNPGVNEPVLVREVLGIEADGEIYAEDRSFRPLWKPKSQHDEGVGMYSRRFPITQSKVIELSRGGRAPFQGGKSSRRLAVDATVILPNGKSLDVIGVHSSYVTPINKKIREQEDETILEMIKGRQNLVLMGDFNAKPNSPRIKRVSEVLRADFDDWSKPTFGTTSRESASLLRPRVDYQFVSDGIVVDSFQITPPGPSNHSGLLLTVSV